MEQVKHLIDVFIHLDHYISNMIAMFGNWTYVIVFGIIFCETGLVFMPFLPGDSLLFVLGALCASGSLKITWLWVLLTVAAIAGDALNYFIGTKMAHIIKRADQKIIKPEHIKRTHDFFEKYGMKTIILARFIPLIRTAAPFLAGVGHMSYPKFALYNVIGAVLWVTVCLWAGYWFGNLPWVEKNFSLVVLTIIFISILPAVFEFLKHRKK